MEERDRALIDESKGNAITHEWRVGNVLEVHPSSDEAVRQVTVETAKGSRVDKTINPLAVTEEALAKRDAKLQKVPLPPHQK